MGYTIEDELEILNGHLRGLREQLDCVRQSTVMPQLLGLVLAAGNVLNAGKKTGNTFNGQADGFEIMDCIRQLESTKDRSRTNSILKFIYAAFFADLDKAQIFIDELNPVIKAIKRAAVGEKI